MEAIKSYSNYYGKNFAIGGAVFGHSYADIFGDVLGLGIESFRNVNEVIDSITNYFKDYSIDEFVHHEKFIY